MRSSLTTTVPIKVRYTFYNIDINHPYVSDIMDHSTAYQQQSYFLKEVELVRFFSKPFVVL